MKILICTLSILAGVAAGFLYDNYHRHKTPPPGWTIVSNSVGRFAPMDIDSGYVIDRDYRSYKLGMSRQRAINRAWEQYEHELQSAEGQKGWK